jgi:hypothetical protein
MGQAPAAFKERTVLQENPLPDQTIAAFGQRWSVQALASGLLSELDVMIFGTITPGAATGVWGANYWPWNLLSELRVDTNQSIPLFQASGYGAMVIDSLRHRTYQQGGTPPASGGWNNTSNKGPRTGVFIAGSGTNAGTTPVPFLIHYKVPITIDDGLSAGLVLLQNQATVITISGTFGQAADFGTLGIAVGSTISATVRVMQRGFSLPDFGSVGSDGMPANPLENGMLAFFHQWIEQDMDWTATGDQLFNVPLGGVLSRIVIDIQNNGAPQDFFSTASDPTTPNLGNLTVQYGANQSPTVKDFRFLLNQQRERYGFDLPAGVLVHDFSIGNGSIEMGYDARDSFDTDLLSAFQLKTNITASPTAGKIRYYIEKLLRQ